LTCTSPYSFIPLRICWDYRNYYFPTFPLGYQETYGTLKTYKQRGFYDYQITVGRGVIIRVPRLIMRVKWNLDNGHWIVRVLEFLKNML
tara:strand:+ start:180 stop:446 length:267 start_codon:yes stop_codon:yes gene_type:complete